MKKNDIETGRAQARVVWPAHVPGVAQGGSRGKLAKSVGLYVEGDKVKGTARRSTGIRPHDRDPIDPRSPNFSPP
ncbi:MAG TPA: hypothetical protein VN033_02295 [Vulgatibacter sp.]|nr:hypothetical protein [Vulgatibacter sp.]